MKSQPSPLFERAWNIVALGLRTLRNDIRLLVALLPRFRDAFDKDELPVSFILKRDARLVDAGHGRRAQAIAAKTAFRPRSAMQWVERRGTRKNKASDE